MNRRLQPFAPASRWDLGVVTGVLIAAVACGGLFFFASGHIMPAGNSSSFVAAFGESENPWAHIAMTGEAARETSPAVRSASLPPPAKIPAF